MCSKFDYLDLLFKIATVLIALCNLLFAIKIFQIKNRKDSVDKESDRKMQLLKTLVLDHNLSHLYKFFDDLQVELSKLKVTQEISVKSNVDGAVTDLFIFIRRNFVDNFLAISDSLYGDILLTFDRLQTSITETIFDQGINLTHAPKFDEAFAEKLTSSKTEILKLVFNYRG